MKNPRDSMQKIRTGNRAEKQEIMVARTSPDIDTPPNEEMISVAAYFRAEQRAFAPGDELADWFQAEAEYQSGSGPSAD